MTTMRAMTIAGAGGPEVLTPALIERPVRVSAEVLVKVVAAGVNPVDAKTGGGHCAVQFAAYVGARVIATSSQRDSGWLRELGAAEVVDYTAVRFEQQISDVDVVIDLIGNVTDDTATRSLQTMRPGGLMVNG